MLILFGMFFFLWAFMWYARQGDILSVLFVIGAALIAFSHLG